MNPATKRATAKRAAPAAEPKAEPKAPEPREVREIRCLYEVAKALNSLDLKASLQQIMKILARIMGMRRGTICILNPDTSEAQVEIAHGLSAEAASRGRYRLGEGITGRVVATGKAVVVPAVSREPLFLNRTRSRGDISSLDLAFICVPIKAEGRAIGTLSVDRPAGGLSAEEDLRLLTIVSNMVAQAVSNLRKLKRETERLMAENLNLRQELGERYLMTNIVGKSRPMAHVYEMAGRVCRSSATVLIRGESGTGKELIAHAIHYNSPRSNKPFIRVSCAALPDTLLESELFGHEKGAFTGATNMKRGRFELAEGGSLFFDEIGEISPAVQVKLLRVLQEREFERLGGTRTLKADVRIIAATNQDLEEAVAAKRFREDLYYRFNVFPIFMPPLRERRSDVLLLAEHFLAKYARENGKNIRRISTPAIDLLFQYHWPGNVRELENCIERAVLICDEEAIKSYHLPPTLQTAESSGTQTSLSLSAATERLERELIIEALKAANGNVSQAAARLATTHRIISYKLRRYSVDPRLFKVR
jgi:Nif-specific regulatory protein